MFYEDNDYYRKFDSGRENLSMFLNNLVSFMKELSTLNFQFMSASLFIFRYFVKN